MARENDLKLSKQAVQWMKRGRNVWRRTVRLPKIVGNEKGEA